MKILTITITTLFLLIVCATYVSTAHASVNSRVAAVAREEARRGLKETQPGCNCGAPARRYGFPSGSPWAGYFTSWVMRKGGSSIGKTPAVSQIVSWARKTGNLRSANHNPEPGDIAIVGDSATAGIYIGGFRGRFILVEGNTNDKVGAFYRSPSQITAFVRP